MKSFQNFIISIKQYKIVLLTANNHIHTKTIDTKIESHPETTLQSVTITC